MLSFPDPGILGRLDEEHLAAEGVHASPVATPGSLVRSRDSEK